MHFPDFETQMLSQQAGVLCREGVYLSERRAGEFLIALYALFDFYAEVWYRQQSNELVMITPFQNTARLDPYLEKINLQGLLQPALYQ
jgi:hypothetical protein